METEPECPKGCREHVGDRNHPVQIAAATRILKSRIAIQKQPENNSRNDGQEQNDSNSVTLIGRSWAGDCTAFVIPELSMGLDAGYIVHGKRMSNYFITHLHTDHAHFLTHLKSRSKPPKIYVPNESVPMATRYLEAAQQMTSHMTPEEYKNYPWTKAYEFVGVNPGDYKVIDQKTGLACNVVKCDHTVPCVGYIFSRVKQKLKPEYQDLPGRDIGKLRKQGIEVSYTHTTPMFVFLGDTTVAGVLGDETREIKETRSMILSCPTVIMECTYLAQDNRKQADTTKHVFWNDLRPVVQDNPQVTFVLVHFSHRWTNLEVAAFFTRKENFLPNIVPWIPEQGLYCGEVGNDQESECQEVWGHN